MSTAFELAPHPGLPAPAGVGVTGTAARNGAVLHLAWRLVDPAGVVALPAAAATPERRHALWDATCFEAFVAGPAGTGYVELNLAPAGHWNLYRLDGYRAGLREEAAVPSLAATVARRPNGCDAAVALDLAPLGLAEAPVRVALAAVVAEATGPLTFWALAHPGPQPDFHHPAGFALTL